MTDFAHLQAHARKATVETELKPCCGQAMDRSAIEGLFAKHNLRRTRQRVALYEALAATHKHPTADELFHDVSTVLRGVSLATVYNTLEAFCDAGLAQKLPCPGGSARYDADIHNHLHLRDCGTGQIHDVPDELGKTVIDALPRELLDEIQKQTGFRISDVRIELMGEFERSRPA